ncbi:hypothetical protein GCM10020219_044290 [Nonomuraea dietziae]
MISGSQHYRKPEVQPVRRANASANNSEQWNARHFSPILTWPQSTGRSRDDQSYLPRATVEPLAYPSCMCRVMTVTVRETLRAA